MRRENAYILELCRFQDADPERLRDWMAQGLDYPYILGHLLFNRMGGAAYHTLQNAGLLPSVNREFRGALEAVYEQEPAAHQQLPPPSRPAWRDAPGRAVSIRPPQGRAAGQPVSGRAAHLKRHGHPHSGTGHSRRPTGCRESGFEQGVLRAGRFRPATRQEIISSRMNRGETVPFVRKVDLPGMPYWEIDINFTLDYQARDSGAVERLLEGRQARIETAEAPLYTLAPADFLLHLCAHLYKEASIYNWVEMGRDLSLYKFSDLYLLLREDLDEALAAEVLERGGGLRPQRGVCLFLLSHPRALSMRHPVLDGSSRA